MTIIKQLYDLNDSYVRSIYGVTPEMGFIAGAELEIECVADWNNRYIEEELRVGVEQDGSLRNYGREFLLPPSTKDVLVDKMKQVHENIDWRDGERFSERTSIHVHVNCLWSSDIQVRDLLFLYSIFEPIFMAYVGPKRRDNIHCMPLTSTHMPSNYKGTLRTIKDRWHKYTALNLLPLSELGTVEFRHLYGTDNTEVFKQWLNMIEVLWIFSQSWGGFKQADLVDTARLSRITEALLTPEYYKHAVEHPYFNLTDNLIDVKLAFV